MAILQLTQTEGDAVGLILPAALLARQNWKAGDNLLLTETADGYLLSSPSAEFEEQVKIGREIRRERWAVLRALAQSDIGEPPRTENTAAPSATPPPDRR
ncbi:AbrB/MazE/SpoVT family DNA-binding domain-containing protein [Variovorax sp. RA8]|uniref:AbrB/MazE/SpoVT family DNA-binding domain-containing protein n=1 Tax=Variovorax sp. (strain JCM 16519 / RA8) TaxID=662548 RepID=UPI001317E74F|nr:AbrB/MazE/SpoVT family DNA-binding domain-containing protein [Variovorax sp. RA8]VTU33937.1 hypothetical protein RA8CHR_04870 [Variovorax sp. RA8]